MSLLKRVNTLEARDAIERGVSEKALLCDYGPYAPEPLARTFDADGTFQSGETIYSGRSEISDFYRNLAANRTMHWYTNFVVAFDGDSSTTNSVKCYGYEAPTIHHTAVVGAFLHRATCSSMPTPIRWVEWEQEIYFLSSLSTGFGLADDRVFNQSAVAQPGYIEKSDDLDER